MRYMIKIRESVPAGSLAASGLSSTRSATIAARTTGAALFRGRLQLFLAQEGIEEQVSYISEPLIFPYLFIDACPAAAARIASLPDVLAVIPDESSTATAA